MRRFFNYIIHSSAAKNTAKLLSANVIAQIVGLLVYPILTRLYSPEDFGLLNLFLSIGGVLVLLSTAEYQYAIVLPREEEKARAIFHGAGMLLLMIVGLVIVSIPFAVPIADLFNTPALSDVYWLMPFFVLLTGVWNILNYWYIRQQQFARISGYQIGQSLIGATMKWGFGVGGVLQGGMIYSALLAPLVSFVISISLSWRKYIIPLFHVDTILCKNVLQEYRNFPIYSLPRTMINLLAGQLPVFLLTPIFGVREVGFWSMAILLGFSPLSMISRAVYQALFQVVSHKVNEKQPIRHIFRHFTLLILGCVIPCFATLYVFLPQLSQWLLGAEWYITGEYIRWMLPWFCVNLLTASTGFLSDIFFRQRIGLLFEILMAVLRTIGVLLGVWAHDFEMAVIGYSVGSAIAVLAQFIWLMSLVRRYDATLNTTSE